jgi:hypothetical protein
MNNIFLKDLKLHCFRWLNCFVLIVARPQKTLLTWWAVNWATIWGASWNVFINILYENVA